MGWTSGGRKQQHVVAGDDGYTCGWDTVELSVWMGYGRPATGYRLPTHRLPATNSPATNSPATGYQQTGYQLTGYRLQSCHSGGGGGLEFVGVLVGVEIGVEGQAPGGDGFLAFLVVVVAQGGVHGVGRQFVAAIATQGTDVIACTV